MARALKLASTTMDAYLKGSIPSADRAFLIADELGVNPRWLITGEGAMREGVEDTGEWLTLPRYDLWKFEPDAWPEPVEYVRIRRNWISRTVRPSRRLWVTELESTSIADIGFEGDLVLCEDAEAPLRDNWVYIFLLDARPVIRRVLLRPEGLMLIESNPALGVLIAPERLEALIPIGRVLASIGLQAV